MDEEHQGRYTGYPSFIVLSSSLAHALILTFSRRTGKRDQSASRNGPALGASLLRRPQVVAADTAEAGASLATAKSEQKEVEGGHRTENDNEQPVRKVNPPRTAFRTVAVIKL
jgi:hypothetical protein